MERKARSWALLGVFVLGWTATACGVEADDSGDPTTDPEAVTKSEKVPAGTLRILFTDNRTASGTTVEINGYEDWHSAWLPVGGKTTVGGDLQGTDIHNKSSAFLKWRWDHDGSSLDDWLFYSMYYPLPYSDIYIYGNGTNYYSGLYVTVRTYIDGLCHEDSEIVPFWGGGEIWTSDVYLYFNGWGATWDGECFRGDMLRMTP